MTAIRIHDTMARKKRLFEPADPARITLYACGPTVYNRAHIGNARAAVVFDLLGRLLRHVYGQGALVYARNVTDVDDKIIDAARTEGVDPDVITARFEKHYLDDMGALGVRPPDIAPHATQTIEQMIDMIERLIETGHAYQSEGHVLFHVPSDPNYGALGKRDREAMIAGARVEVAGYKKDPADFVLWKPSDPDVIGWDSPWGRGRPGWHIECSAMIEKHLGETIDIHGGGLDLIFPHHENEIAQSSCAHGGAPLARYWMHNGFLTMAGSEKMSKSLGNVVTVGELLDEGHRGEAIRLALLSAHYRQPLEWSAQLLAQSKATLDRWYRLLGDLEPTASEIGPFWEALFDDLNTPKAIAVINEFLKSSEQPFSKEHEFYLGGREQMLQATAAAARALGFLTMSKEQWFQGDDGDDSGIDDRIAARADAKARKDFAEADRIRAELAAEGIVLEDFPSGTTWRRV